LQRETHLELQDSLVMTYEAAARAAAARQADVATRADAVVEVAMGEFHAAAHRAAVLESRIEDSNIRTLATDAIASDHALARASGPKIQEAPQSAGEALEEAILELGFLIAQRPSA
jgi:hypothetical protein